MGAVCPLQWLCCEFIKMNWSWGPLTICYVWLQTSGRLYRQSGVLCTRRVPRRQLTLITALASYLYRSVLITTLLKAPSNIIIIEFLIFFSKVYCVVGKSAGKEESLYFVVKVCLWCVELILFPSCNLKVDITFFESTSKSVVAWWSLCGKSYISLGVKTKIWLWEVLNGEDFLFNENLFCLAY